MIRRPQALLWLLLLCFLALPVMAQIDKASIEAVAFDQSKAPLPGVTITVVRPETGFQTVAVTDTTGLARIPALTPGQYSVEFTLEGFAPVKESNLVLHVGENAKLAVTMKAAASETITVAAQAPMVDVHKSDDSTNIIPEQIEALPVADRQFERLAFIAPGVERERGGFRFITGGPVIGSGGNASQTTVLVDGVDMTDQVNGLARARFSQDAVREFRVVNDRFDTEIGGSSAGALSIVTKSGTNNMHGNVFGFFRDSSLRSKGALDLEKNNDYSRHQLGFTLGGPFIKDKLFYFGSVEQINEKNIVLFRPGGAYATRAADISHPFDQTLIFASVDTNFTPQITGGFKGVYENYKEDNFRVGGVADESYGQTLERRNWNGTFEHNWSVTSNSYNEARLQYGTRRFYEPTNSTGVAEWFSSGNTLMTGGNILGNLLGDGNTYELRDTWHQHFAAQDIKAGLSYQRVHERFRLDTYEYGLFIYVTDTRQFPLAYAYGVGSSDVSMSTNLAGAFIEDSWHPTVKLAINGGLRYDLDTNGNNPGYTHPLIPKPRPRDTNNYQPRVSFSYDLLGNGTNVLRGGVGRFTGRFLLVPALSERQQNGITGRVTYTRINGALLGLPAFALDPNNPTTTGIPSKPSITLLGPDLVNPQADQASLGYTVKLGSSRMFLDTQAIYAKGTDEITIHNVNWTGNATRGVHYSQYQLVNFYDNSGHSKYRALVFALNGNVRSNDLLTASVTLSSKKNISDDFSPDFTTGYPNDPANMAAEWGRARGDERYRLVLSGVFHLPLGFIVAPIYEYGSGQPWTRRVGYDWNGDSMNSDREIDPTNLASGSYGRNTMDGPPFRQLSLRITKSFPVSSFGQLEVIAEGFNITNVTNYDVQSVNGGYYLSGPTAAQLATLPPDKQPKLVTNPLFGKFSATLPPREFQLGLRWVF